MTKASGTAEEQRAIAYLQWTGWLQDHDRQIYEQGKRDGIEWHPYPKEKPKENESYLVTYEGYITGNSYVNISRYFWDGFVHRRVTAWAELPKPYEEGAEE
ncbi:MAG: hypothetical protein K6F11_08140 [Lachnospiraceae bacterium]|nr:hypothetical protein [Lachnospiraceae bacterium]